MKYLSFIGIVILCTAMNAVGQNTEINKLIKQLNAAKEDSVRLALIINIANAYDLDQVDSGMYYAKMGVELAQELNDSSSLARVKSTLGIYYGVISNYTEALRNDLEALNIAKNIGLKEVEANALNSVGEDYYNLDLYNQAFEYYSASLKESEELNDSLMIAIGTYNIGRVLYAMDQLASARKYFLRALDFSLVSGDSIGVAYANNDIALIDIKEGKWQEALDKLKEAYDMSIRQDEEILTPQIISNMALAYQLQGNHIEALAHYDDALKLYEQQKNKSGVAQVIYGKGKVSLIKGNIQEAKEFFDMCEHLSKEINDNERLIECYEAKSELYESMGDLKNAFSYYKSYKKLEDSVFSEKKKEQFDQFRIQYETENKDFQIKLLNQREKQQIAQLRNQEFIRNILVVILAFISVLLYSLYKNNLKRKKINDLLVKQQAEIEAKSKELSSLVKMKDKFFSIISHDLRSPINALVGILEIIDDDKMTQNELRDITKALRLRLSYTRKLMDTVLNWAMTQMNEIKIKLSVVNLTEIIEENFSFFNEAEEKKIELVNDIKEKLEVKSDKNMVELILRNLISNSIKFTTTGGKVVVAAEHGPKDTVIISVSDNGVGMSPEQRDKLFDQNELYTTRGTANERGAGLGLRLCKEFVERLGGSIWVESEQGKGTTFKFTVNKA